MDVPDPRSQDRAAAQPARRAKAVPDPAAPRSAAAQPGRKARVTPGPAVPDRGAFEPPPKDKALSGRSSRSPGTRGAPGLAAAASAAADERSAPPAVPQGVPKSAAKAEPSWAAVLATTARLWVQRRAGGPDPARRRRWRAPALIALALVLAAAGGIVFALYQHGRTGPADPQPGAAAGPGAGVASAAAVRYQAAGWFARQVDRDATVACDPVMCAALHSRGFPAANLVRILPARPDPLGAELVVATAALRNQFGARLATVYAPQVIARFGTGQARIEVRTIPPEGASAFLSRLGLAEREAREQGRQILGNRQIMVSPEASAALAGGHVDDRLLATLAALAEQHPLQVIAFGDANPGAGPGIPLRSADLAGADRAAGLSAAAYQRWLLGFLRGQRAEYRASSITTGQTASGEPVVQIEFAAPST
jgi:hypothetical protein